MKQQISLTLSEDLVKEVDGRRGLVSRSAFVETQLLKKFMEEVLSDE